MSKDKNWAILDKNPSWYPGAPGRADVAHFRLLTGHDCLRSHPYRIGITSSPNCTLGDSALELTKKATSKFVFLDKLRYITDKIFDGASKSDKNRKQLS
ncbi:hypothetical protein TNCV_4913861 [Trichonephila clavipes]|nr:hypothetical protein TNCV_4913861 [Trichonephila clavipes]